MLYTTAIIQGLPKILIFWQAIFPTIPLLLHTFSQSFFSIQNDDAIKFDLSSLKVRSISEFKEYHDVNVSIKTFLDKTSIPVSIDIGFGDVIYPKRSSIDFPVLLNMDIPNIFAYSVYSVVAEKFEAFVS